MRVALVALLLSLPALADPPPQLLPKDAPPAAIDFSGHRKLIVGGIALGAGLTAVGFVALVILLSMPRKVLNPIAEMCGPTAGGVACPN
jgi:hypothetical protein